MKRQLSVIRCWSRIITKYGEPNHVQIGAKTACGITVGSYWDYEITSDLSQINCIRCRKTNIFKDIENANLA